jgi:lipooligosaccharide transport system ATP-binding protein
MDEAERLCDRVAIMSAGRAVADGAPRALVERYVGPQALELDCSPQEETRFFPRGADANRDDDGWQRLRSGNRLVVYAKDAAEVAERVRRADGGDGRPLVIRPSNLEDVFLAATGSDLQEHA